MFTTRASCENGSVGYYIHKSCDIKILSSVQLQKAQQRKQKERDIAQCSSQPSTSDTCGDVPEKHPTPNRLRSSVGGPLHDKIKAFGAWRVRTLNTQIEHVVSCLDSTQFQLSARLDATQSSQKIHS